MRRGRWLEAGAVGVLVALAGCGGRPSGAQVGDVVAPVGRESGVVSRDGEGVYSEDQAERGEARFTSVCGSCHATEEFTGPEFWSRLAGSRVFGFFDFVRTNMPWRNPNTLTRDQYAEVVAYIIRLNGFPSGSAPLPSADAGLREVYFPAEGPP